jgi:hypothetical protein
MKKNKSSISKARSYAEIGEFWDKHDLSDYWGKTRKVKFDVVLEPEATYYPVQKDLSEKIQSEARKRGFRRTLWSTCGSNKKLTSGDRSAAGEDYRRATRRVGIKDTCDEIF